MKRLKEIKDISSDHGPNAGRFSSGPAKRLVKPEPHVSPGAPVVEADKMKGDDPCWKGYNMVGMKDKGGKKVPNCVPTNEQDDKFSRYMPENDKKPPFDGPYTKTKGTVTDKSGAKHSPMSRARTLARDAMKKVSLGSLKKKVEESRQASIVREAAKDAKEKAKTKDDKKSGTKDKFEAEPELTSQIVTTSNQ